MPRSQAPGLVEPQLPLNEIMSQATPIVARPRLFLRNGGAAAMSGAAVALLAGRAALAESANTAQPNLHGSAILRNDRTVK